MKNLKVLYLIFIFISMNISCGGPDYYFRGKLALEKDLLNKAKEYFAAVPSDNQDYDSARYYIDYIDKLIEQKAQEKVIKDSLDRIAAIKNEIELQKKQAELDLEAIKYFNGDANYYDVSSIIKVAAQFKDWGNRAMLMKSSEDPAVVNLGKRLQTAVVTLQKKEFPIMRKRYAKLAKDKLWEENITVSCFGTGNTTLQFVGGIYANNKNKKETQEVISSLVHELRFKRVNYKWIEHDDEYTYYTIESLNDSEIDTR